MNKYTTYIGFLLIFTTSLSSAKSTEEKSSIYPEDEFYLGLALTSSPSMYEDKKQDESIIPIINWAYKNWFLRDYRLGSYLHGQSNYFISTSIGFESISRINKANTNSKLKHKKINQIYNGALSIGWFGDYGLMHASVAKDISQGHQSHTLSLSYRYELPLGSWSFQPTIRLMYLPAEVANYYYGVKQNSAGITQSTYYLKNTYTTHASLDMTYHFDQFHSIVFGIGQHIVSDEIKNSPLTVDKNRFENITLGYVYAF